MSSLMKIERANLSVELKENVTARKVLEIKFFDTMITIFENGSVYVNSRGDVYVVTAKTAFLAKGGIRDVVEQ